MTRATTGRRRGQAGRSTLTSIVAVAVAGALGCGDDGGEQATGLAITSASAGATSTGSSTGDGDSAGGTSSGSGGVSASAGSTATTTSGGLPELPCDPGFVLSPLPAETGAVLKASFTHAEPLTYIDMVFSGPGVAEVVGAGITSSDPWTWAFDVALPSPGVWTASFLAGDPQATVATCQVHALDTGAPPDVTAGDSGDSGDSGGECLCGEGDGCEFCPMVGACLDPPAPIGPNGPGMTWECLDNAGCDGGSCKIWCPFEPCDAEKHPKGCPNNTEACWVPSWMESYEEACKHCCETEPQSSCWDEDYNVCRYPGECGTPLP
ncbi:MAG: hypothetical protein KC486_34545, partial [Myxococcales bacterium]|nr:hypothetical protein [Myxococcales bacterium]